MTQTRRRFLKTTTAAVATVAANAYAGGGDMLRVGLIGCGSRGTGAASQALKADRNVKLVAMGDAFEDRLNLSLNTLRQDQALQNKLDVRDDHKYVGFDAYRQVIAASDVVLLCTPPGFRPMHLAAAIEANKHVFAEKPVAVDAPGIRSVLATCAEARRKNRAVVSGLCLRYELGFKEVVRRVHDGAIGDPVTLFAHDYRGGRWARERQRDWSDMTYQMRNWYNFTWLSGDFNVEQHVHFLDVCAWLMKDEYPVKAIGMGGRQVLTGPEYGNIYDHFAITYTYANGARLISSTRQQRGCKNDLAAYVLGQRGSAELRETRRGKKVVTGGQEWVYEGPSNDIYQTEHDELFASIRNGRPINNGEYMTKSTLLAIMGRMAAYTGQEITWEQAMNSRENLSPPSYTWDQRLPDPPVAIPGVTRFS
jgi:predicted dehydrogenase